MKKLTQSEFLERVAARTKRPVDLANFVYVSTSTKGVARCPEHGEFSITPNALMNRIGCPVCALNERSDKRRMSNAEFVRRAVEVHGDKYDYSAIEYTGSQKKVRIICRAHGEFTQVANSHLSGKGCSACRNEQTGGRSRETQVGFITKALAVHGDKYDLSKVDYLNSNSKITVICKEHGPFYPRAGNFINSRSGCPHCAQKQRGERSRKPLSHFVVRGAKAHSGSYGYSGITYKNGQAYLKVVCVEHGEFEQLANDHMKGIGCRDCAKFGFSTDMPATFYVYRIKSSVGDYIGFGITNSMTTRHKQHVVTFKNNAVKWELLKTIEFHCGGDALALETMVKRNMNCVNAELEGFRTEALSVNDLANLLDILQTKAPA